MKVIVLLLGQALDDPPRILPLGSQPFAAFPSRVEELHGHRETFPEPRDAPVGLLAVTPEIDDHHAAVAALLDETPYPV